MQDKPTVNTVEEFRCLLWHGGDHTLYHLLSLTKVKNKSEISPVEDLCSKYDLLRLMEHNSRKERKGKSVETYPWLL